MFVRGHAVLFLRLWNLGSKGRHKATTRNGVPQGIGRARHTPYQTVFDNVCSEYAVLFLCLCNFVSKTLHKGYYL